MRLLALGMAAHWLLARFLPSPWWVPNATLAALVLSVIRRPGRWLLLSWAAGCFAALWTIRAPGGVLAAYMAAGAAVQLIARRWDLDELRAQCALAGAVTLAFTLGIIWLEAIRILPVLGPAIAHAALTAAAVPFLRRMMPPPVNPPPTGNVPTVFTPQPLTAEAEAG